MNRTVAPLQQSYISGWRKYALYLYSMMYIFGKYSLDLLSGRLTPYRYAVILYRLMRVFSVMEGNKVVKINGTYKFQLYLPAFPSKAFFHYLQKFDPATKEHAPVSVVFSMTKACGYKCPHCYQRLDSGPEVPMDLLTKTAQEMQNLGIGMFDIEGGEPLIRFERLLKTLEAFDDRAEIWVNTTGHTLTLEKAQKMRERGVYGVFISIHRTDAKEYDAFTGIKDTIGIAQNALKVFQQVGINTAINYCPSYDDVKNDNVKILLDMAREYNASFVQIIHGKPSGLWLNKQEEIIVAEALINKMQEYHVSYNTQGTYKDFPAIAAQVYEEQESKFGCTAGGIERFYLNHEGEVQPCEFLNVSFGNIKNEPFMDIFRRMRAEFKKPGTNWLCCSERESIAKTVADNDLKVTPIKREHTEPLVKKWEKGDDVPLYKGLGIYKD